MLLKGMKYTISKKAVLLACLFVLICVPFDLSAQALYKPTNVPKASTGNNWGAPWNSTGKASASSSIGIYQVPKTGSTASAFNSVSTECNVPQYSPAGIGSKDNSSYKSDTLASLANKNKPSTITPNMMNNVPLYDDRGTRIPDEFRANIKEAAAIYGVDPVLIVAIIGQETEWKDKYIYAGSSSAGAKGIMQIMPDTYAGLANGDPNIPSPTINGNESYNPKNNIMAGAKLLSQRLKARNGDVSLALGDYNYGQGNVNKNVINARDGDFSKLPGSYDEDGNWAPHETTGYVYEVPERYNNILKYNQLTEHLSPSTLQACATPKDLPQTPSPLSNEASPFNCLKTDAQLANKTRSASSLRSQCIKDAAKAGCLDIMPVDEGRITDETGWRSGEANIAGGGARVHRGMDYGANAGTPVRAAADGYAICKSDKTNGNMVQISHYKTSTVRDVADLNKLVDVTKNNINKKDTFRTSYAHLQSPGVKCNQAVKKGEIIGYVGTTGRSTGNHLHFEIRDNYSGEAYDPMCDDIMALCGDKVRHDINKGCRDCDKNPQACQQAGYAGTYSPSNYGGDSNYSSKPVNAGDRCSISSYRKSFEGKCFFCNIFAVIFNVASQMASTAWKIFAHSMITVVMIGFALWLALTVVKYISAMETVEPRQMMKLILNQAFVVIVVVVLLGAKTNEFNTYVLEPLFKTGMNLAQIAVGGGKCTDSITNVIKEYSGGAELQKGGGLSDGLPKSLGDGIVCTIKAVQDKIMDVMHLGSVSICVGLFVESWHKIPIFPHLGYLVVGLLLWMAALLLMIIYPFLLIDALLQMAVAAAMMPFAIASFAFKVTRNYTNNVWNAFMNAMFNFVFLSIIIYMLTDQLMDVVGKNMGNQLKALEDQSSYKLILEQISLVDVKFLKLIFIMLLGWAVLGSAKKFASNFASGLKIDGIGSSVGTFGASTAMQLTKRARQWAWRGAARPAKNWAGGKIKSGAIALGKGSLSLGKKALNRFKKEGDNVVAAINGTGATKQVKPTTNQTSGDNIITKQMSFGANGKQNSSNIRLAPAIARNLTNKDGTLNANTVNQIRNNSTMSKDDVDEAIMAEMMAQRMDGVDMGKTFTERKTNHHKNARGNDVFQVRQTLEDGATETFVMTTNTNSGRAVTSFSRIDKNGKGFALRSDGIVNTRAEFETQNGAIRVVSGKSGFAKYYDEKIKESVANSRPVFESVPENEVMLSKEDLEFAKNQVQQNGVNVEVEGFK